MGTIGLAVSLLSGRAPLPAPKAFASVLPPYHAGARFAVIGDVQPTGWIEFWRESNAAERRLLFSAVAAERPEFAVFTGDLVFDGSSGAEWAELDRLAAPLHESAIAALAVLGNHDYWGGERGRPFFDRFPSISRQHRLVSAFGPLRLVLLDSNVGEMTASEWTAQRRWVEDTLPSLDADPSVGGVLVVLHHPPFTNSTVTGDEPQVVRDLVPPFLAARKTVAMLSGHVHSYERFCRSGKTFVVSGAGGGPRARLAVGDARRHPDDLFSGPALRGFEFLVVSVDDAGLEVEVRGLDKGAHVFSTIDRFALPFGH